MSLAEWEAYHARLADAFKPAAVRGLQSAAYKAVLKLQQRTRTAPPMSDNGVAGAVDTGSLLRSWRWTGDDDGALIYGDAAHAPVQDGGRRAGRAMPPTSVIEDWLVRRAGFSRDEAKRAAYPVARAIGRRGLRGRQIMSASDFQRSLADMASQEILHELEAEVAKK